MPRNCLCNCVHTCYVAVYVTVYVPDYVTVIHVLGSGTNEGSSPRSGCGRPPSLVPTKTAPSIALAALLIFAECLVKVVRGHGTANVARPPNYKYCVSGGGGDISGRGVSMEVSFKVITFVIAIVPT